MFILETDLSLNIKLLQQPHTYPYKGSLSSHLTSSIGSLYFVTSVKSEITKASPLDNIHLFNLGQDFPYVSL